MNRASRLCEPGLDPAVYELNESEVEAVSGGLDGHGLAALIIRLLGRVTRV